MMRALVALALIAAPATAYAQSDSQLWSEASVSHELSKRAEIGFGQHLRLDDGASRVAAIMPEVGATYEVTDWLRLGAGYRFMYKRDDKGELGIRHRLQAEARARYEHKRIRLGFRHRWQDTARDLDASGGAFYTMRNRVLISWQRRGRVEPSASVELFHRVGDGNGVQQRARRLTFGVDIDLRSYDLEVFYRHEQPFNDNDDVPLHIIGLGIATEL